MTYDATWGLSTIPSDILKSEWGRRTNLMRVTRGGGRKPTCMCGGCRKCKARGKRGKPVPATTGPIPAIVLPIKLPGWSNDHDYAVALVERLVAEKEAKK